jgi:hypothetical protein
MCETPNLCTGRLREGKAVKRETEIAVFLCCVFLTIFLFTFGLWLADASASALINSDNAVATNGWLTLDPVLTYHFGIYMLFGSFALLMGLTIFLLAERRGSHE